MLQILLKPRMLRRTKAQELGHILKGKQDIVVWCQLAPLQAAVYRAMLELPDFVNARRALEECPCGQGSARGDCDCAENGKVPYKDDVDRSIFGAGGGDESDMIDPKAVLWKSLHPQSVPCPKCPKCMSLPITAKLQKVANHPALLQVDTASNKYNADERGRIKEFAKAVLAPAVLEELGGSLDRSQRFEVLANSNVCGKLKVLDQLLTHFESKKDKCLIFSYSTQTLDVISAYCTSKGWRFCRLDGTTPTNKRQGLVDTFNTNPSELIFLISTKAGGAGLNLQSATKVIIFDVCWNPTHDQQAQDRAYRIGQKDNVQVFRFVSQGTIEEMTYMRQVYKGQLTSMTIDNKKSARMFEAIEGDKANKGELYGMSNLMKFNEHGRNNPEINVDLKKKKRVGKQRKGKARRRASRGSGSGSDGSGGGGGNGHRSDASESIDEFSDDDDPLYGLATTRESDVIEKMKKKAKVALETSEKGNAKVRACPIKAASGILLRVLAHPSRGPNGKYSPTPTPAQQADDDETNNILNALGVQHHRNEDMIEGGDDESQMTHSDIIDAQDSLVSSAAAYNDAEGEVEVVRTESPSTARKQRMTPQNSVDMSQHATDDEATQVIDGVEGDDEVNGGRGESDDGGEGGTKTVKDDPKSRPMAKGTVKMKTPKGRDTSSILGDKPAEIKFKLPSYLKKKQKKKK